MTTARPEPVDLLIRNAWVVTMDDERRIYRDGAIAIKGSLIHAVGSSADIEAAVTAREVIDGSGFVLTPGFVNCHIHVTGEPLTRGLLPDNLDWRTNVFDWLIPTYAAQTPEEERLAAQLAALEMLRTGTTCFVEAGTINDLAAVHDGLTEIGIRGRFGQRAQDRAKNQSEGSQAGRTADAVAKLHDQIERYPARDDSLVAAWPALVGHVTATDELWREATQLARFHGLGVTAHMSPDPADPDFFLATTGRRPIEHLDAIGALGGHLSLTHAIFVNDVEVALLAASGTHVTHCPMTAMKGAYGVGPWGRFPEMAAAGVPIQLGTDGHNNGNAADMMRAMYVMAGLHKDARRDPSLFSAYSVLEAATVTGAAGAQLDNQIGSLEVGKKADIVAHDRRRPEWVPLLNVVNQLVWSADGRGVHSVWVDGRRVVTDYRATLIDEDRLFAQVETAAPALIARTGRTIPCDWPVL